MSCAPSCAWEAGSHQCRCAEGSTGAAWVGGWGTALGFTASGAEHHRGGQVPSLPSRPLPSINRAPSHPPTHLRMLQYVVNAPALGPFV